MKLNKIIIFLLTCSLLIPATPIYAQEYTIEAFGTYLMGDGPDENINTAKNRARTEALRQASEQAGVYIESYSKINNAVLTNDEIEVVSAQVCKVKKSTVEPEIIGNHIQWKCSIVAVVNTDNIDLKAILADKRAVIQVKELQQMINNIQNENKKLKEQYEAATNIDEKKLLNNRIIENGESFNKAIQELPVFVWGKWNPGIDLNSVRYDKNNQTIIFNCKMFPPKAPGYYIISYKLYINRNSTKEIRKIYYSHDGAKPFDVSEKEMEASIRPDSYEEVLQSRLYDYLGITTNIKNNQSDWRPFYTEFEFGKHRSYYIDINNCRYIDDNNSYLVFVKSIDDQDAFEGIGRYYCDFNGHRVGVSDYGDGNVDFWISMDYKASDMFWQLKKNIYEAARKICNVQ